MTADTQMHTDRQTNKLIEWNNLALQDQSNIAIAKYTSYILWNVIKLDILAESMPTPEYIFQLRDKGMWHLL